MAKLALAKGVASLNTVGEWLITSSLQQQLNAAYKNT
jgi:hypothetical protein